LLFGLSVGIVWFSFVFVAIVEEASIAVLILSAAVPTIFAVIFYGVLFDKKWAK